MTKPMALDAETWMQRQKEALTRLERRPAIIDTGWEIAGVTLATGWGTLAGFGMRKWGPLVEARFTAVRTGATITPGANGDFADVHVATISEQYRTDTTVVRPFGSGSHFGNAIASDTIGRIFLLNTYPGSTIATGATLFFNWNYLVE